MALIKGTITTGVATVSATSQSVAHSQDSGADGHLIVAAICKGDTVGFNLTAKYNGVAMSQLVDRQVGAGNDIQMSIFELDDPATGSNNVLFEWAGFSYSGDIRYYIVSYTGCLDVVNGTSNAQNGTPTVTTSTFGTNITMGSDIICCAYGCNTFAGSNKVEIPQGTSVTIDYGPFTSPGTTAGEIAFVLEEGVPPGAMTIETNKSHGLGDFGAICAAEIKAVPTVMSDGAAAMMAFNF